MDALKILMVDDEARMRKLVRDFLANKRIFAVRGSRGRGGGAGDLFRHRETSPWSLLDVMMPKDGRLGSTCRDDPGLFQSAE